MGKKRTHHSVCLPPHCNHLLQPLDVSCYGPLEQAWNSACHRHLRERGGNAITRYEVCVLACRACTSTQTASYIQAAFRKSSVLNVISPLDLAPSTAFKNNNSTQAVPEKSDESFFQTKGGQILKMFNRKSQGIP